MKFYLTAINSKFIHSNLAVYSLRASAKEYSACTEIGEFTINNQKDEILAAIYKANPDVLFFSVYIWNLEYVISISKEFNKLCPDIPIWVGGPEVSYESGSFLVSAPWVTGVIVGEGEQTFYELCSYYAGKSISVEQNEFPSNCISITQKLSPKVSDLEDISGIAYRCSNSHLVHTGLRLPGNMDDFPFAYEGISLESFENKILYYESSRGCPFSCSYCLSSVDKHLRFKNIELVKKELTRFLDAKVKQVKFVDRTFNCMGVHSRAIWAFIKEHDNGITNFHFEIAADLLTEADLDIMKDMRPGLIQLEIGVQSTNPDTIWEIHRHMNFEVVAQNVSIIKSYFNIHQHLDLIAGLPYEDYASFGKSFDDVYALRPDQLQLGFLKVLKGSDMAEEAQKYDITYHDLPPYEVTSTRWLSFDDILSLKQIEEMVEVYYNSGQFSVTMELLSYMAESNTTGSNCFSSCFALYEALGNYYESHGYFGLSHSRNRRAEILIEFVDEYIPQALPMIKESLVFDLYLRENCKSRPEWADNQLDWKDLSVKHCQGGKLSHLERFHYDFTLCAKDIASSAVIYQPVYILLDYTKKDPLTGNYNACRISP